MLLWLLASAAAAIAGDEAELGPGVSLTVYNQNFAVVKERRLVELAEGTGEVKFPEVAATIVPESVQFSSLRPGGAEVLEQNYEFDLVSADKLLDRYIDRKISIVGREGGLIEGTLLSSDRAQLVLSNQEGVHLIPRGRNVKDVRFSSLPEGLLTHPTLVWLVRSQKPGSHLVKVAYRANKITWRADYRAALAPDEKTLDLAGWVTVTNNTGTRFEDAELKLMAGDVHLVRGRIMGYAGVAMMGQERVDRFGRPRFEEKSFADYHLYRLDRRATLANNQTKQIQLIEVPNIPVAKAYLYRTRFGSRVGAVFEFKNSKETHEGLGVPLPMGPFRVYRADSGGQLELVGKDEIGHTPKDEPVRILAGYAPDVVAERVQTALRQKEGEKWKEEDWQLTLRNHKDRPIKIAVEETVDMVTPFRGGELTRKILQSSDDFTMKDFRTMRFDAEVPANGQKVISYTVRYTW